MPLFGKIVTINTVVLLLFMALFIKENYNSVYKQLMFLEDEKFQSIGKTIEPVISINLTLGLEKNYKEAIQTSLDTHKEIVKITLEDTNGKLFYQNSKKPLKEDLFSLKIETKNILLKETMGAMTIYYTHSNSLKTIVKNHKSFLLEMFFLFLLFIALLTILIYFSMKPLKLLTKTLKEYSPSNKLPISLMEEKDEVSVINNTVLKLLERIDQYTHSLEDMVHTRTEELHNSNQQLLKTQNLLKDLNQDLENKVVQEVNKRMFYVKELAHQSRLASMGMMIDNIAHQWRQPLMAINSNLINLERLYELNKLDEATLDSKITEITNLTAHMSKTIEDFRKFFKKEKKKESFEVEALILDSINLLGNIIKNTMICFDPKNCHTITSYKSELIQVLLSLLTNSVEALKTKDSKEKRVYIYVRETQHHVEIIIEDSAGGIERTHLEKIFEPYYSTKHQYGGSGLGLYICKLIIEDSMDGEIEVSNSYIGAEFTIRLKKEI